MRIISGIYKGKKLFSPEGNNIRPTSDRAKETLFNILNHMMDFTGMKCLDIFCGSGALGLELISRGAESCIFVDTNTEPVKKNVSHLSADDKCDIIRSNVLDYLKNTREEFDIVICDPPYDHDNYDEIISLVSKCGLFLALEHSDEFVLNPEYEKCLFRRKKIGTVNFTLLDFNKT